MCGPVVDQRWKSICTYQRGYEALQSLVQCRPAGAIWYKLQREIVKGCKERIMRSVFLARKGEFLQHFGCVRPGHARVCQGIRKRCYKKQGTRQETKSVRNHMRHGLQSLPVTRKNSSITSVIWSRNAKNTQSTPVEPSHTHAHCKHWCIL